MKIGERIARYREKSGMSQEELAHLLGYKSRSTINKIEKGERNVPKKMIAQLSIVLNVSPLNLLAESRKSTIPESKSMDITGRSCVYKYVCDNKIIYVGKSDNSLINRLNCHKSEVKFKPYLKDAKIYYAEVVNPAMSTILETYLINKYKPELNSSMKYTGSLGIELPEPDWKPWN